MTVHGGVKRRDPPLPAVRVVFKPALTLRGVCRHPHREGRPGTAQAGTWISLEPGFVVHLNADHSVITVERDGVAMQ
jgi:hypothetical protein